MAKAPKMLLLSIETAYYNTNKQIKKEKGSKDYKTNKEENPIGVSSFFPSIIYISDFYSNIHKVLPSRDICDDK